MPPPGLTGCVAEALFSGCPSIPSPVRLFICYQTWEDDIL